MSFPECSFLRCVEGMVTIQDLGVRTTESQRPYCPLQARDLGQAKPPPGAGPLAEQRWMVKTPSHRITTRTKKTGQSGRSSPSAASAPVGVTELVGPGREGAGRRPHTNGEPLPGSPVSPAQTTYTYAHCLLKPTCKVSVSPSCTSVREQALTLTNTSSIEHFTRT